jgi:5-methylcytosine-specific restriction endonuclease McrA
MPRFTNIQRKQLINSKGTICCNCLKDEKENIMFHHIVPVSIGGTDNDSNIVPLCQTCH